MLSSKQIRQMWLDFFASKRHLVVPSKSLIPVNDPSLLWINSGVATLKDYFSGKKIPPAKRLTNSQKSIRTNDIENVGVTARHHTFFEMLGNFSIGDYFKKEAINFGYEFIFDVLKLEKDRIYITYFAEDKETYETWIKCGISPDHLIAGTRDTNFWDVGQGPCGPDTEIFYDRGPKYDSRGIELLKEDLENDRFIEIWNIVFSQYNNDGENNYSELISKNIDTGAGLERIVSIMQDAPTNFDTDLFLPIIKAIEKLTSYKYDINNYFTKEAKQAKINTYFKIIADHMRASVNAINDGVSPSNVGRGYIIRRLIRRSYRAGISLGISASSFLYKLVKVVKDSLIYEIDEENVAKIIKQEEELFAKTIKEGEKLLENEIKKHGTVTTEIVFKMFDTYGFPIELTSEILKEKNIAINLEEFKQYLKEHQEKSRGSLESGMNKVINSLATIPGYVSEFIGYDFLKSASKILYLLDDQKAIAHANDDEISYLILDKTPFYATSGGQNHDHGYLKQGNNIIEVLDVFKDKYWNHVHKVKGSIDASQPIECYVDEPKRLNFARNHSSTHLMYHALRETYPNEPIEQLGSNISFDHFTFDFGLDHRPTVQECRQIEKIMRSYIAFSAKRNYIITTIKKAQEMGAWMTIEESEYHDANKVRVVEFENITKDVCGGTHVPNSSVIEDFKIVSVDSKGTDTYRLRVVTSSALVNEYLTDEIKEKQKLLSILIKNNQAFLPTYNIAFETKIPANSIEKEALLLAYENIEDTIRQDYKKFLKAKQNEVVDISKYESTKINGIETYIFFEDDVTLTKKASVELREKYPDALVLGLSKLAEKNYFFIVASKAYDAHAIFKKITTKLGGKGGGNSIVSQGSLNFDGEKAEIISTMGEVINA
ncbi:Alanine--tRNA ligase [Metamycoplasma arthritidis]|uniref:Alanine--tRNA ligase n=1 Tax=Metamycoplasma arthritidis (strain 158L3-1) TaxID=243272 RepID=B3PM69_META1|nr:alanine--tRNA ligase [Metamycoplasma arthritidis]ACF07121.1 alanyl-tRNA synthetase [Metamycoplasma arthritidis 158L3-1]VEU78647.1 Alanine--tRNA ligase [Metamycoplasma arthritidis]